MTDNNPNTDCEAFSKALDDAFAVYESQRETLADERAAALATVERVNADLQRLDGLRAQALERLGFKPQPSQAAAPVRASMTEEDEKAYCRSLEAEMTRGLDIKNAAERKLRDFLGQQTAPTTAPPTPRRTVKEAEQEPKSLTDIDWNKRLGFMAKNLIRLQVIQWLRENSSKGRQKSAGEIKEALGIPERIRLGDLIDTEVGRGRAIKTNGLDRGARKYYAAPKDDDEPTANANGPTVAIAEGKEPTNA